MIIINKPPGKTPLQVITQYKNDHPELTNEVISYAGRLDPMAEGQLLLLIGKEENKQRRRYEKLDKTYEFEILVGFSTDTYDIMGLITQSASPPYSLNNLQNLIHSLPELKTFPYPPYSSKYVNGHPLYWYAKRKLLETIVIPTQTVTIYSAELLSQRLASKEDLVTSIERRLSVVQGNFRQREILRQWQTRLDHSYPVLTVTIACSSGTYVRSIVHHLSQHTRIPMLAFTIKRTKIQLSESNHH